jgi:predicted amidohydrolase
MLQLSSRVNPEMKVAAYQAPLLPIGSMEALGLIEEKVRECEVAGISILCCPEAILGGLADYAEDPFALAIPADRLDKVLAPLASDTVATIVGFTELGDDGKLYNSAAVFHRGAVLGIYRKIHPFINHSVYSPGTELPVFTVDGLTFGIIICYDSTFPELAQQIAAQGATALFIPTNTGLPPHKTSPKIVDECRQIDQTLARDNNLHIIRADVVGHKLIGAFGEMISYGSSGIVNPDGRVVRSMLTDYERVIMAEVAT